MKILVTGGAGFIGSALVRYLINNTKHYVINVDKLIYPASLYSLQDIKKSNRYQFEKTDISNNVKLEKIFAKHKPQIIFHLAAETHVDTSINSPNKFIKTNILGTYSLLEVARNYLNNISNIKKKKFKFIHVSTDEVYGDLGLKDSPFKETNPYKPSSPYSASKASSDHLVRSWGRTFKIPYVITNCSNNYGPYQFPEKLIPNVINRAINGLPIMVYGDGKQIRDWLYVEDHIRALIKIADNEKAFCTYNIGGSNEIKNINVVLEICDILEKLKIPKQGEIKKFSDLINFIEDRPGHDMRYGVNSYKIRSQLKWKPNETFRTGLKKTVVWYVENKKWLQNFKFF